MSQIIDFSLEPVGAKGAAQRAQVVQMAEATERFALASRAVVLVHSAMALLAEAGFLILSFDWLQEQPHVKVGKPTDEAVAALCRSLGESIEVEHRFDELFACYEARIGEVMVQWEDLSGAEVPL